MVFEHRASSPIGESIGGAIGGSTEPDGSVMDTPITTSAEVLTVDELAALLRLNRKTIYEALARGEIPGTRRIGRSYRVSRRAVLEWLSDGQVRVPRSRRQQA